MDDYAREMLELKTLITRTLEKRGVLARIRAELRANIFAAIEEEDRAIENEENPAFALLGKCNERAKQLHASPTGKLLSAMVCDYLEWCELEHTLKVYLPECDLPKNFWKAEIKEKLGESAGTSNDQDADSPLLLKILESYLKAEPATTSNLAGTFTRLSLRRSNQTAESTSSGSSDPHYEPEKSSSRRSGAPPVNLMPLGRKSGFATAGQANPAMRNSSGDHALSESQSPASYESGVGGGQRMMGSMGGYYGASSNNRSASGMRREELSGTSEEDSMRDMRDMRAPGKWSR